MSRLTGVVASVAVAVPLLLVLAPSMSMATDTRRSDAMAAFDIVDFYIGAHNMNLCCDCHSECH